MCCGEIVSLSHPRIHCLPDKNTYMSHAAFSCFCYALGKVPRDCLCAPHWEGHSPALRARHSVRWCGLDTVSEQTRVGLWLPMRCDYAARCGGSVLRPYRGRTGYRGTPVSLLLLVRCCACALVAGLRLLPGTKTARHAAGPRTARWRFMSV